MGKFEVKVGGFYVCEAKGLVRELTQEQGDGDFHWRSYDLRTGRPTGDRLMCSGYRISQWANREATPEEVARMKRQEADKGDIARASDMVEALLAGISDERLFAEVRRRGRQVT